MRPSCRKGAEIESRKSRDVSKQVAVQRWGFKKKGGGDEHAGRYRENRAYDIARIVLKISRE